MYLLIELEPGINSLGLSSRILISSNIVFLDKILHSHSVSVKLNICMSGLTAKGDPAME